MEKSMTLTTQIHSLWQGYNHNTARQGFHYKRGLNLGGAQFFPAGVNHGQVFSPLGIFLICLQIGKAGGGGGGKEGEAEAGKGINSMDFCSVFFQLKLRKHKQQPTKVS